MPILKYYRISIHYNGFALIIVSVLIVILTVSSTMVFKHITSVRKVINELSRNIQMEYLAYSGLYKILNEINNKETPSNFSESIFFTDSVSVTSERNGLFTKMFSTSSTLTLSMAIGFSADDLFPHALSLSDFTPRLVISAGTYIEGDISINEGEVIYSPPYIADLQVIDGNVLQDSIVTKLSFLSAKVDSLTEYYLQKLINPFGYEFTLLDGGSYYSSDINKYKSIYFEGDVYLNFDGDNTLTNITLLGKNNIFIEGNSRLDGAIKLVAGENIFIRDSTNISDALLVASGAIYFEGFSISQGQFISKKQILVTDHAEISFPSYLIVPVNSEKTLGDPEVGITKNSQVNAAIFVYISDEDNLQFGSNNWQKGKVKVSASAFLSGGIYCEGVTEIYGIINGFVYTESLEQMVNKTRWTNYLKNTQIFRHNISPKYPIPNIFDMAEKLSVLEVRRIN